MTGPNKTVPNETGQEWLKAETRTGWQELVQFREPPAHYLEREGQEFVIRGWVQQASGLKPGLIALVLGLVVLGIGLSVVFAPQLAAFAGWWDTRNKTSFVVGFVLFDVVAGLLALPYFLRQQQKNIKQWKAQGQSTTANLYLPAPQLRRGQPQPLRLEYTPEPAQSPAASGQAAKVYARLSVHRVWQHQYDDADAAYDPHECLWSQELPPVSVATEQHWQARWTLQLPTSQPATHYPPEALNTAGRPARTPGKNGPVSTLWRLEVVMTSGGKVVYRAGYTLPVV